ncbi:MAG TPA: nuclear transport factor 2 family protein [Methylibium sp.]|nr:nuclear transport factor 2 family protein [Methylibium sp.]
MPLHPLTRRLAVLALAGLAACTTMTPAPADRAELARQVAEAERAFAKTMADRDHAAFTRFLADEAVFFNETPALRGKAAVAAGWRRFFEQPAAPFSWEPDQVEVLDSGTLAFSTGPVRGPDGKPTARFKSVWRLEAPGVWRVVFDSGCNCP